MDKYEYSELFDYRKIEVTAREKKVFLKDVADKAGISKGGLSNIIAGKSFPTLETVLNICAAMKCSVSDVVDFKGYAVRDFYKDKSAFTEHEPDNDSTYRTSFEPLRNLFKMNYGDQWEQKLRVFFEVVPRIETSPADKARVERMMLAKFGPELVNSISYQTGKKGITGNTRNDILNDRPVNIRIVYNICKVLCCPPEFVVTYK